MRLGAGMAVKVALARAAACAAMLLGAASAQTATQMLIVAGVGTLWFRVPFNGQLAVVLTGLALFMLTCIGLGLFVSLISHTRRSAGSGRYR